MTISVDTASIPRDTQSVAKALLQLTKPGVTRLVLVTSAAGALVAPQRLPLGQFLLSLVGTAAVVGAANALNMVFERDVDALMERTRMRPLPQGRLTPEEATIFGVVLAILGLSFLSFFVAPITGLLAAVALVSYVLVYTPLKRVTPMALHVGAIPGAIPPLLGWTSVTGRLDGPALSLFLVLFVWQLPHFLAITLFRQEEYRRAGLRVYAAELGAVRTRRAIVVYSLLMVAVSFLPLYFGLGSTAYAVLAALVGVPFILLSLVGLTARGDVRWARTLFFASLPYLVLIYGGLVVAAL
ncbi:MAG TPA: heme o synthase [Polyangiaceae bacterium]|nr:heme o synthase [Polyangiaceae bacterium]HMR75776.1 heme o synthase [Polyangiaceae bacterium]